MFPVSCYEDVTLLSSAEQLSNHLDYIKAAIFINEDNVTYIVMILIP